MTAKRGPQTTPVFSTYSLASFAVLSNPLEKQSTVSHRFVRQDTALIPGEGVSCTSAVPRLRGAASPDRQQFARGETGREGLGRGCWATEAIEASRGGVLHARWPLPSLLAAPPRFRAAAPVALPPTARKQETSYHTT